MSTGQKRFPAQRVLQRFQRNGPRQNGFAIGSMTAQWMPRSASATVTSQQTMLRTCCVLDRRRTFVLDARAPPSPPLPKWAARGTAPTLPGTEGNRRMELRGLGKSEASFCATSLHYHVEHHYRILVRS